MQPEQLTFDIPAGVAPAHRINAYQWNKTAKDVVLCVHGLTRNAHDFDYLATVLSYRYRVIAIDVVGRGKSEWLGNTLLYNNPTYIADIAIILRQLGIKHLHWIGTSMGGILGMMMANSYPGLIRSMLLNDVGCLVPVDAVKRIMSIGGIQTSFANRAEAEVAIRKRCAGFGIQNEQEWQHLFTYGLEQMPDGSLRATYDPAIFPATMPKENTIAEINLWPLWPAITSMPVLLIRGAESDILTHQTASKMQTLHPSLTLYEVLGAGHAPALMADEQTAYVRQWLDEQ